MVDPSLKKTLYKLVDSWVSSYNPTTGSMRIQWFVTLIPVVEKLRKSIALLVVDDQADIVISIFNRLKRYDTKFSDISKVREAALLLAIDFGINTMVVKAVLRKLN